LIRWLKTYKYAKPDRRNIYSWEEYTYKKNLNIRIRKTTIVNRKNLELDVILPKGGILSKKSNNSQKNNYHCSKKKKSKHTKIIFNFKCVYKKKLIFRKQKKPKIHLNYFFQLKLIRRLKSTEYSVKQLIKFTLKKRERKYIYLLEGYIYKKNSNICIKQPTIKNRNNLIIDAVSAKWVVLPEKSNYLQKNNYPYTKKISLENSRIIINFK